MQERLSYSAVAPGGVEVLRELESYVKKTAAWRRDLLELVRLCASQINGCAFCIDMHTKDARTHGESEQRLYAVSAWREAPFYTQRERAALAWTEAVTRVGETHVPDDVYAEARRYFSERELVDLTFAIIAINGWNRLAVSFRPMPGSYQPNHPTTKKTSMTAQPTEKAAR